MGWARANIFYDKLAVPPRPGTLQEALCMLVFRYRQRQRMYEAVLSTIDLSGGSNQVKFYEEVMEEYKKAMFPYISRALEDEKARIKRVMDRAFLRGPIKIVGGQIMEG